MASNRVVTYIDMNINSVEEYWNELIVPSAEEVSDRAVDAGALSCGY